MVRVSISTSATETKLFGSNLAKELKANNIVAFLGDLGAGKTTLIKGIVMEIGGINEEEVSSPTFVYLNCYSTKIPIFHFDLYRLKEARDFVDMGFLDYLYGGGIALIEWSDKILDILPKGSLIVELAHHSKDQRKITISNKI